MSNWKNYSTDQVELTAKSSCQRCAMAWASLFAQFIFKSYKIHWCPTLLFLTGSQEVLTDYAHRTLTTSVDELSVQSK